jgi:hypothetical protein
MCVHGSAIQNLCGHTGLINVQGVTTKMVAKGIILFNRRWNSIKPDDICLEVELEHNKVSYENIG